MEIVAVLLLASTVICLIALWIQHVNKLVLIYYMLKKGTPEPSIEELKECRELVIKHIKKDMTT